MDADELASYREAGKIAVKVREETKSLVKTGAKILEVAEAIESRILGQGAGLAFPVNICINDVTAHYTPKIGDETTLSDKDVVSVDLGVHVDGFIADTAYTMDLSGEYGKMLEANETALSESIKLVKPGLSVSRIGETVQNILQEAGFKPIENLTGHEVQQYDLHAGLSVPNIKVPYDWIIEEDMVLALEPFATDGYGRVVESRKPEIYSVVNPKPIRLREARVILKEVEDREGLPFAERWLAGKIGPLKIGLAFKELVSKDILKPYPPLHEVKNGRVSQFEHTIIVTSDGCEVTTR
ncbi:MAG: type II methionyl aminopeptidase [Candidatus Altiarchaeota archaeon]